MAREILCDKCVHRRQIDLPAGEEQIGYMRYRWRPAATYYYCVARHRRILKVRTVCKPYTPITQKLLKIGGDGMVKLGEIPDEGERMELSDLPQEAELIAISEKYQEKQDRKTAGLVITYQMRDGQRFPQKYGVMAGRFLKAAMVKLKLTDTVDLQKSWYSYKLTPMRTGYPRMMPEKKVKK